MDPLAEFPVTIDVPVAWGDMDALGHVNNTVYLRWFESARIAYFDRVGWVLESGERGVGPILARTQAVFRSALAYPDRVRVGARVTALCEDRFTMLYRVVSEAQGRVACEGDARVVSFDYGAKAKSPLPDAVRQGIEALERSG